MHTWQPLPTLPDFTRATELLHTTPHQSTHFLRNPNAPLYCNKVTLLHSPWEHLWNMNVTFVFVFKCTASPWIWNTLLPSHSEHTPHEIGLSFLYIRAHFTNLVPWKKLRDLTTKLRTHLPCATQSFGLSGMPASVDTSSNTSRMRIRMLRTNLRKRTTAYDDDQKWVWRKGFYNLVIWKCST